MNRKNEQVQAANLSEFYAELAKPNKNAMFRQSNGHWTTTTFYPAMESNLDNWEVRDVQKKIVDMRKFVDTEIDMEFFTNRDDNYPHGVGKLAAKVMDGHLNSSTSISYFGCKPRLNHWNVLDERVDILRLPAGIEFKFINGHGVLSTFLSSETPTVGRRRDGDRPPLLLITGLEEGWEWGSYNV